MSDGGQQRTYDSRGRLLVRIGKVTVVRRPLQVNGLQRAFNYL
jgi:hypothetical protein